MCSGVWAATPIARRSAVGSTYAGWLQGRFELRLKAFRPVRVYEITLSREAHTLSMSRQAVPSLNQCGRVGTVALRLIVRLRPLAMITAVDDEIHGALSLKLAA